VGFASATAGRTAPGLAGGQEVGDIGPRTAPPPPTGSGFTLGNAFGISDNGYIAATGTLAKGQPLHAILLTPVSEPCGLVLLGAGAVALLGYYGARRR
jgi:hypothetical protein